MLNRFRIAETENFSKKIKKREYQFIYEKIYNFVYPQLRLNPYFGPNIKKLKGEYSNIYRYRIGQFRLFYIIDSEKILIMVLDITPRKDSYRP